MISDSGSEYPPNHHQSHRGDLGNLESCKLLNRRLIYRNNIIWYTGPASHEKVVQLNAECIAISRGPDRSEYADFRNATRTDPIELRFRGEGKLGKLRLLKKTWDPDGIFTRQFLD